MSILTREDIDAELRSAPLFYRIVERMGYADIFTCPVSLEDPYPWRLQDDYEPPASMSRMLAILSPTSSMPALEVRS